MFPIYLFTQITVSLTRQQQLALTAARLQIGVLAIPATLAPRSWRPRQELLLRVLGLRRHRRQHRRSPLPVTARFR